MREGPPLTKQQKQFVTQEYQMKNSNNISMLDLMCLASNQSVSLTTDMVY